MPTDTQTAYLDQYQQYLAPIENRLGYYQDMPIALPDRIRELHQNFILNDELSREQLASIESALGYRVTSDSIVPERLRDVSSAIRAVGIMSTGRLFGIAALSLLLGFGLGYLLARRRAQSASPTQARWA